MAKTKRRTNGKATAAKPTREKLEEFDVGLVPAPRGILRPEDARRWLAEDFKSFQALVGLFTSAPAKHRDDLTYFTYSVGKMVRACHAAIESGRPVRLTSDYYGARRPRGLSRWPGWHWVDEPLRLLCLAFEMAREEDGEDENLGDALHAIHKVLAATQRAAQAAYREESRRSDAKWEARKAARSPERLHADVVAANEKIRRCREERESVFVGIEAALAPLFDARIEQCEFERDCAEHTAEVIRLDPLGHGQGPKLKPPPGYQKPEFV